MNAHGRRKQRRAARRRLMEMLRTGESDGPEWRKLISDVFLTPLERQIDQSWKKFHALPPDDFRRPRIMSGIRKLQAAEADAMEARANLRSELKPGEGYAALAMGQALILKYSDIEAASGCRVPFPVATRPSIGYEVS